MHRTSISLLVGFAVLAAAVGWLGEIALAAAGLSSVEPPVTLTLALLVIAVIVVVLGWPIRQALRGKRDVRIDPFKAMRVLVLAKASSRMGALFLGAAGGILVFFLTRGVLSSPAPIWASIAAMAGAMIVGVCGIIVELWCRLPPEDEARQQAAELQRR
jgi:4-hydroxybenzoate polyprenyltransferase